MSLVRQDIKSILLGIAPEYYELSGLPGVVDSQDLLPSSGVLKAISWLPYEDGHVQRGPHLTLRGPAETPEGVFYINESDELYALVGETKTYYGQAIECSDLVGYKGCLGVLNPGGVGGFLVYPPHKYPIDTPREGFVSPLGFAPLGKADTNGCFWFGSGELGLVVGVVQYDTYLLLFCQRGILAWNIIYDFNNFLGSYNCVSATGGYSDAFFIGATGALYKLNKLEVEYLGYEHLFKGRDLRLWWEHHKGILFILDRDTKELWLFKEGLTKASIKVYDMGWDSSLGRIWFKRTAGDLVYFDDISRSPSNGWLQTNFCNLGLPGPKRFHAVAALTSVEIPLNWTVETELENFSLRQEPLDSLVPIDREANKLRLRLEPVGLNSGEVIQTSLLIFKPLDRRLQNDVVSNG